MTKKIIYGVLAVLLFAGGFWLSKSIFQQRQKEKTEESAVVLLEKMQKVFKLVTVEGQFVETYDQLNTKNYTIYLPFPSVWSFPKSASVQVQGKVLVGYDMEGVTITLDSTTKEVVLKNLPIEAEILAVDHELSYKNLKESYFNKYSPADYTKLNANAKEFLRQKAAESRLLEEAKIEGNQMLDLVSYMASSVGWTVVVEQDNVRNDLKLFID